ncbi:MAG TPA: hypothetical protein VNO30_02460 [Kofleriaceae bacterium]|nr:hypothetical protein [Kofleriaceae bacterium]
MIEALVTDLGLGGDVKMATKGRWRGLDRKAVNAAIASPATRAISLLVGTPLDVRLGGWIELHLPPPIGEIARESTVPPLGWFAAESQRWPEATFVVAARRWLQLAAKHAAPISGGVLAAADLRNAKVEIAQEFETYPGEVPDRSPTSFRGRMEQEPPDYHLKTKLRRVYPITLLGPRLASQVDVGALQDAGATNVESINGSIIFDSTRSLIEAWSPEFLATTTALRRLLWPLSTQNPVDDPDAKPKRRR